MNKDDYSYLSLGYDSRGVLFLQVSCVSLFVCNLVSNCTVTSTIVMKLSE